MDGWISGRNFFFIIIIILNVFIIQNLKQIYEKMKIYTNGLDNYVYIVNNRVHLADTNSV